MMYVALAAALIVLIGLAVFDVFWPFTVLVVLGIVFVWWMESSHTILWLFQPEYIIAYIVIGFVWVFFKWTRLVEDHLSIARESRTARKPPQWSHYSYDFAAYFFYWPLDMAAYILSDIPRKVWTYISTMVGRSFDRYAEWRFRDYTSSK